MNKKTRKRLEAAGFRIGDAEDFLGLTEEERRLVELRLAVSRAVRTQRVKHGVTQQQLASKLKSSQSRVAKIESAAADVSLDLSFAPCSLPVGGSGTWFDCVCQKERAIEANLTHRSQPTETAIVRRRRDDLGRPRASFGPCFLLRC